MLILYSERVYSINFSLQNELYINSGQLQTISESLSRLACAVKCSLWNQMTGDNCSGILYNVTSCIFLVYDKFPNNDEVGGVKGNYYLINGVQLCKANYKIPVTNLTSGIIYKYYDVFGNFDKIWEEAATDCQLKGGNLATITDSTSAYIIKNALFTSPYNKFSVRNTFG